MAVARYVTLWSLEFGLTTADSLFETQSLQLMQFCSSDLRRHCDLYRSLVRSLLWNNRHWLLPSRWMLCWCSKRFQDALPRNKIYEVLLLKLNRVIVVTTCWSLIGETRTVIGWGNVSCCISDRKVGYSLATWTGMAALEVAMRVTRQDPHSVSIGDYTSLLMLYRTDENNKHT